MWETSSEITSTSFHRECVRLSKCGWVCACLCVCVCAHSRTHVLGRLFLCPCMPLCACPTLTAPPPPACMQAHAADESHNQQLHHHIHGPHGKPAAPASATRAGLERRRGEGLDTSAPISGEPGNRCHGHHHQLDLPGLVAVSPVYDVPRMQENMALVS